MGGGGGGYRNTELFVVLRTRITGSKVYLGLSSRFDGQQNGVEFEEKHDFNIVHFDTSSHRF